MKARGVRKKVGCLMILSAQMVCPQISLMVVVH
jgi:hypothetical protein